MGERSLSATSLNSYPPAYYDRPTPDMGPRQVSAWMDEGAVQLCLAETTATYVCMTHRVVDTRASVWQGGGGNVASSVNKLAARMDRLDISAEGPAYGGPKASGGRGGRPHMRVRRAVGSKGCSNR